MTWTSHGTSPVDKPMWTLENPGCLDSGQWMVHDLDKSCYFTCRQAYVDTGESWMLGQWSVEGI